MGTDAEPVDGLSAFSQSTRAWFERTSPLRRPRRSKGWPAIASRQDALIQAPTGSGKTLAAFLCAIDKLERPRRAAALRVLYVSPLKALNYDVERNLRAARGIAARRSRDAARVAAPHRRHAAKERARDAAQPPDILITTPESLFLLLTSDARAHPRGRRDA